MKINPKINKRVNDSVAECRKVIIEATIELLKSIGAECGEDVSLGKMLFLYQNRGNTTKTAVCNMISYEDGCGNPYYLVAKGDGPHNISFLMSFDNLLVIYDAVKAVVRSE